MQNKNAVNRRPTKEKVIMNLFERSISRTRAPVILYYTVKAIAESRN